jgi:hypothetical protein
MREALATSRQTEYFTEQGLRTLTNTDPSQWNFVIFKELLDNALDAVNELEGKIISITHTPGFLAVIDNGPGIPEDELDKIFDFNVYLSSKRDFRTPTRGYQGNALKTVIGIAYQRGMELSFSANGKKIRYELDDTKIKAGIVEFTKTVEQDKLATNNRVSVSGFEADADFPSKPDIFDSFLGASPGNGLDIKKALWAYRLANPDVTFIYNGHPLDAVSEPVKRSDKTFIHWYDLQAFNQLLQAVHHKDPERTVKQFCSKFSGSQRILSRLNFPYRKLSEFCSDEDAIKSLYQQLRSLIARPKPEILKSLVTGEKALLAIYGEHGAHKYKMKVGEYQYQDAIIPYIIEGFLLSQQGTDAKTQIVCSVNNSVPYEACPFCFSQTFRTTFPNKTYYFDSIASLLDQAGFHKARGLTLYINFISPFVEFTDKAKTRIISDNFANDLVRCLETLLKDTLREIARAERANRAFNRRCSFHYREPSKVELIERHFMDAFNNASGNGEYICTARQVFYALRQILINRYGKQLETHDYNSFTQNRITDFFEHYPGLEDKIFFEQRGTFHSPFSGDSIPLSTKDVRRYIAHDHSNEITSEVRTVYDLSPELEFQHVLYVEKAGFNEILKQSGLVEKLNIGLMSTQGFATRAGKQLARFFIEKGIKVYVLHDCDLAGYLIADKFLEGSRTFREKLDVIDIGLNVADVEALGKINDAEVVQYRKNYTNIFSKLSSDEREFFITDDYRREYRRVELNALSTPELLKFVESKIPYQPLKPTVEQITSFIKIDKNQIIKDALFKVYGTDISIDLDINRIAQEIHENVNGSGHWINTLWSRLGYAIDTEVEKLAWRIRNEN